MRISLSFGEDDNGIARVAVFESKEQKIKYVEEEQADRYCLDCFYRLQAARTPSQREEARDRLGVARYLFYKHWCQINDHDQESVPGTPLDELDDIV